jgi:uncharacterized protein YggE
VKLKPDRATVMISVVTTGASAAEAGRLNAARVNRLVAALRRQGLPDTALVTGGYSVEIDRPEYGDAPRPAGLPTKYRARNTIRVSLVNLEALGGLVDSALVSGASEIDGITFASSQAAQARTRAIAMAVNAARADAEAAAAAAGGTLGRLIQLKIGTGPQAYALMAVEVSGYSGARGTPMMPGDVSVQVGAEARYAFVARP